MWWIPLETAALFSHTAGICIECVVFPVAQWELCWSALPVSESRSPGNICYGDDAVSRLRLSHPHELSFVPDPKSCLPELSSFVVSVKQTHVLGHEEKQHFC